MTATEYVILVDVNDKPIGQAEKLSAHANNELHRAFSVFIFRENNQLVEVLLQQRAFGKYHSGGLWTNTCCSHPRPDEDILSAAKRRLQEEFGFSASLADIGHFHYNAHFANGLAENEIDHVLIGSVPQELTPKPDPSEIQNFRWVSFTDLDTELKTQPDKFTPWFKEAYEMAKKAAV